MKRYITNFLIGLILLSFVSSCNSILEEQPRSVITPELLKTPDGLKAGLTASYSSLRYISGTEGIFGATVMGTDEFTAGSSAGAKELDMGPGDGTINSASNQINLWWVYSFSPINTCNGIIEFGPDAGIADSIIAEAYFLRGYYYFYLAQNYGGVPLDLGSGNLKFNTNPTNLSTRSTQEEVYQAVIADLKYAEDHLPRITPRFTGCPTRAAAVHYLAKVYLQHGDNQLALTEAEKLLNPNSPYSPNPTYRVALLPKYSDVIRPTNEHNAEVMFTCEHTETYAFNETAAGFGSGPLNKDDRSLSYFVPNYGAFKLVDDAAHTAFLTRTKEYSRPWMRFRPTYNLFTQIFADRTNDSRYDATWQTVWLNNNSSGQTPTGFLNTPIKIGDTAFVMLPYEVSAAYRATKNYRIWTPSQMDRVIFPALKKFFDPNRQDVNDASGRPFMLAKLSETYLIAAEAALNLGNNTKAYNYILILRKRAAIPGHEQAMVDATPTTITIDYILDERSRELCGEQMRWFDLKRTGKWRARSTTYSLNGVSNITRDIKNHYDLRPIPSTGQVGLMGNSDAEKRAYQNPGY